MLRVNQIKVTPGHSEADLKKSTANALRIPEDNITSLKIIRQSIDARKKPHISYSYSVDVTVKEEEKILRRFRGKENQVCRAEQKAYRFPEPGRGEQKNPTVIVGTGPAGLFCGYFLALHGYRPVLLERGKCVEERRKDVEAFWETGQLNPDSNVQFGEGGAGTFSDGKLNTLVKDRDGRNRVVLETFVKFGAKERICYDAKPHIGTDVLCDVVRRMREEIIRLGGQVRFGSLVTEIELQQGHVVGVVVNGSERIACEQLVLAIGHSARDTFAMLHKKQVPMEAKAFAVGLRMEHPQSMVNESQYGMREPGSLGAAPYRVAAKAADGRGVYSFCMCPGGYVVNASSESGHTAVNGMSYSGRDGKNANSAIIVTVTPEDFGGEGGPLAGIAFQRRLEQRAFEIGGGKIPVQRYGDFRRQVLEDGMKREDSMKELPFMPQCKGQYQWADVAKILPLECNAAIVEGIETFAAQIKGFNRPDACLSGVESRTSSPVRILRDDSLQSQVRGLYPCGEGAGYAGGIVSAAMDGIRVAEQIATEFRPVNT
ncbi:MAG TPA: FAD-dependent oxidoreductase [Lachnospiraceae bacterium]|nr:FAD-dependent oxidoreductase [Lachnospiraceae bacterium]